MGRTPSITPRPLERQMKPNSPSSGQDHLGTVPQNLVEQSQLMDAFTPQEGCLPTRRQWFCRAAGSALLASIAACRPTSDIGSSETGAASFRVLGASMAPTLYGNHLRARCKRCWIDVRASIPAAGKLPGELRCWHCGAIIASQDCQMFAGDLVDISPFDRRGDAKPPGSLVALELDGRLRVKRVLAGPGDEIDLDGLPFLVNGQLPVSSLGEPVLPVDLDWRRAKSRWSGRGWQRDRRRWQNRESRQWLVYTHRNIHDHGRVSRVWDDYPGNIGLARQLQPVGELLLTMNVDADKAGKSVELEIAVWSPSGVGRLQMQTSGGRMTFSSRQAGAAKLLQPKTASHVPVSETSPLAIRVTQGLCTISKLQISRPLQYRLRPRDDRTKYPLKLAADQYFVVGDNVPVSIDSRLWGPVNADQFIGTVSKRNIDRSAAPRTYAGLFNV